MSNVLEGAIAVRYETDNGEVALSSQIIRDYLVSGRGRITEQENQLFLRLCQYQRLNPFLREAYLIKYSDDLPATMVVGKEVFTKRVARHPQFNGWQAGVTVLGNDGEIIDRDGALVLSTEKLVGGWVRVSRKDWPQPLFHRVGLDEYAKTNARGETQRNWASMPATMIRKVALVQGLRDAFPEQLQGLYSEEEEAPVAETKPNRIEAVTVVAATVVAATSAPRIDPQPSTEQAVPDIREAEFVDSPPATQPPVQPPQANTAPATAPRTTAPAATPAAGAAASFKIPYGDAKGKTFAEASDKELRWFDGQLSEIKLADPQYGEGRRKAKTVLLAELKRREDAEAADAMGTEVDDGIPFDGGGR